MSRFTEELRSLVGNEGGFVHKSFIGRAIGKVVGTVTEALPVVSQVRTGIRALGTARNIITGRPRTRTTVPRTTTARVTASSIGQREFGARTKFGGNGGLRLPGQEFIVPPRVHDPGDCMPPLIRGPNGLCIAPTSPLGASRLVGEATLGQYGAALIPGSQIVDRATCLRGMQLGNDGLCYNKGQISNKQRMWPAGRKPLLTGGDMRAISTAARAGRRMDLATKRLQKMGMMKKPAARRGVPAGHRAKLVHASEH